MRTPSPRRSSGKVPSALAAAADLAHSDPGAEAATREALLDAAEALFARFGFDGTSLRQITAQAKANLASVNYHFGSKEKLFLETWARRIRPINERRRTLLADVLAKGGKRPKLEDVLEAYIRPLIELAARPQPWCAHFQRLVGRIAIESEGFARPFFEKELGPLAALFRQAVSQAEPDLKSDDVFWSMFFLTGSMFLTLNSTHKISTLSGGEANPRDAEGTIRRLVAYAAAGARALRPGRGPA